MAYVEISYRGYQVRNFITGQSQCTKVGGTLSEFVDLLSGVIQGSVLGPLFFLTFINELAEILESQWNCLQTMLNSMLK